MPLPDLAPVQWLVSSMHWLAGFVVLAEGLNKLHRTDPLQLGLSPRQRLVVWLKATAWALLVLAAGGAVIRPLVVVGVGLHMDVGTVLLTDRVSLVDLFALGGFAILIVRSRLKES